MFRPSRLRRGARDLLRRQAVLWERFVLDPAADDYLHWVQTRAGPRLRGRVLREQR